MQGPQTAVWSPCNSSITHVRVLTLHGSCQYRRNLSVSKPQWMFLIVIFKFLNYNVCDLYLFWTSFSVSLNLSHVFSFSFVDFYKTQVWNVAMTRRCGKHSYLLRSTNKWNPLNCLQISESFYYELSSTWSQPQLQHQSSSWCCACLLTKKEEKEAY